MPIEALKITPPQKESPKNRKSQSYAQLNIQLKRFVSSEVRINTFKSLYKAVKKIQLPLKASSDDIKIFKKMGCCSQVNFQRSTEIYFPFMTNVNSKYHAYNAIFPFPVTKVGFEGTKVCKV